MTTFMPELVDGNTVMLMAVKSMFVVAGFLYLLFAFLITKQVLLMSRTLKTTISARNKTFAYLHLAITIFVLIYYLLVL